MLHVLGGKGPLPEAALRKAVRLGSDRTFEQDPKYPLRLLVDIAIKALSPAINDPTTAVQALDQIEDLLRRLARGELADALHYLYRGTIVALGEAGRLTPHHARTTGDYVRQLRADDPERQAIVELIRTLDRQRFGTRFKQRYKEIFPDQSQQRALAVVHQLGPALCRPGNGG